MPTSPAPAPCARASPCCKGWPSAGAADVASPCTTKARNSTPGYHCANRTLVNGRGERCLSVGGAQIDQAVTAAFLAALEPAGVQASVAAAEAIEADHDAALAQWRRQVERARYEAARAERRYLAVDPDNRLVARGLEADWEAKLASLADAEAELARREAARPRTLSDDERRALAALGADVGRVWSAPTTTDRDRKELLRTLLEDVRVDVHRDERRAELDAALAGRRRHRTGRRTARRPSAHQPHRRGHHRPAAPARRPLPRRHHRRHPQPPRPAQRHRRSASPPPSSKQPAHTTGASPATSHPPSTPDGELVTVTEAATILGVAPSTFHRWLNDGFIAGEQLTPGAPWRIRLTDELRARFIDDAPPGWLAMLEATLRPGRVPPDRVAACQARRARRRPRPLRTQKRPADQGKRPPTRASSTSTPAAEEAV